MATVWPNTSWNWLVYELADAVARRLPTWQTPLRVAISDSEWFQVSHKGWIGDPVIAVATADEVRRWASLGVADFDRDIVPELFERCCGLH